MSKEEPMEVTAEVMGGEITPMAKSELWLAGARERVAELAAQYRPPERIEDDRAYKAAKADRASARKDAAALDAERKAMTREMDEALKRFRSDVRDVLVPLTDIDAAYKAALDDYEARWGAERRQELQDAYEEYAPDLMPLVPLDRLIARYGSDRGRGWLMRSTNIEAAKAGLRGSIDSIAAGERTVEAAVDPEDAEAAKADYFSTLDIGQAIANAQARAEQRERVRRLEEERARREAEYRRLEEERLERERLEEEARREAEAQAPAEEPEEPTPAIQTGSVMSREEASALWSELMPDKPKPPALIDSMAQVMGQPDPGRVPPYIMCCYGSRADADAFRAWCARRGVKATVRETGGSIFRITRRA